MYMPTHALLIVNPNSGNGEAKRWIFDMADTFLKKFDLVTLYFSKGKGDIIRMARENAGSYDAIIAVGGDGTLSETIAGLHESGVETPLGYIPTGTVNDFATSHGIPKNIKGAIDKIAGGTPKAYDIGLLADKPFTYVAAFGAFTDVAYLTPQDLKASFGKTAYIAEGMKRLASLSPITCDVVADDIRISGRFLLGMATNSRTVGGFRFFEGNTENDLRDGLLELLLIRFPETPAALQEAVFGLLNPKAETNSVLRLRGKTFTFAFPEGPTPWTIDGEFGGGHKNVTVSCAPLRIRVIE